MLIIFEMANNHGGSVDKGKEIIAAFREVADKFPQFQYAMKYQYRDLPTFIHPSADPEHKYVKRFRETNLSEGERYALKETAKLKGFLTACTPFDEKSVDDVRMHGYDILKVGSPSFTDWPLWEKILSTWNGPIIASCGGAMEDDIDMVVEMCRGRDLTLMHCVSEYPIEDERNYQLYQISYLKNRYGIPVGWSSHGEYSTYEFPLAFSLGAVVIEMHVATGETPPNRYSHNYETVETELRGLDLAIKELGQKGIRIPGPIPSQFQRKNLEGRMWWKP